MFKQITYKMHSNVNNVCLVNVAQIKCVVINVIEGKENCFSVNLQFGGGCNISCNGFIVGGCGTINAFFNGEDTTLFIDSTKL